MRGHGEKTFTQYLIYLSASSRRRVVPLCLILGA
jgi:hypothetical protein